MAIKSNIGISSTFFIFAIILLAGPIDARKGSREYWEKVMKGQPMPNAIKVLVNQGQYEVKENKATPKGFVDDNLGSTTPDVTIIYDSVNPTKVKPQTFSNGFDSTTPDVTIIYDSVNPTKVKAQTFNNGFDSTTPDATIIYDSVNPTKVKAQTFNNGFDSTIPDVTIIYDSVNPTKVKAHTFNNGFDSTTSKKLLVDDFEPIPNISAYNE